MLKPTRKKSMEKMLIVIKQLKAKKGYYYKKWLRNYINSRWKMKVSDNKVAKKYALSIKRDYKKRYKNVRTKR